MLLKRFVYKMDVLKSLNEKGYNTYVLRKNNILPQSAQTKMRNGVMVGIVTLESLCNILGCTLNDIVDTVDIDENAVSVSQRIDN